MNAILFSRTTVSINYLTILFFSVIFNTSIAFAASPVIFYSDLVNGPNAGGYMNNGAFVTIWGKNFGDSRGSSNVTVGGGEVVNYPIWSDSKICFQLGHSAKTGKLFVTTSEGSSNGIDFVINDAVIKFVNGSGGSSGTGTYENPYSSPAGFINYLESRNTFKGAILYFFSGDYTGNYGETTWNSSNFMLTNRHKGSVNNSVAYIAYPGQEVTIANSDDRPCFQLGKGSKGTASDFTTISQFTLKHGNSEAVYGGGTDRHNEEGAIHMRVVGCDINGNYGSSNTMTGMVEVSGDWNYILGNDFENNAPSAINNNHAVYVQGGADHTRIGYNVFHRMKLGHVVQVHSDGGQALIYEDTRIYSNIFTANNYYDTRGFNAGLINPSSYGYIYNNVFANIGQDFSAVTIYNGTWRIFNNTFYKIRARLTKAAGCIVSDGGFGGGTSSPHPYVQNNIFYMTDGATAYLFSDRGGTFNDIDTNIYYGGQGTGPGQGLIDKNPANMNPELVDPEHSNFNLQPSSCAIGAGILQSIPMEPDLNGIIKSTETAVDIGALELSSSSLHQSISIPKNFSLIR